MVGKSKNREINARQLPISGCSVDDVANAVTKVCLEGFMASVSFQLNIGKQIIQALMEWESGGHIDLSDVSQTKLVKYFDEIYHKVRKQLDSLKNVNLEVWLSFSRSVYLGEC
jgi:hypothetical protein